MLSSLALLAVSVDDEAIAVLAVVLGILGIALPASIFGIAFRWAKEHRELSGSILGAAFVICLLSVGAAAVVTLAIIGWIPPLDQLLGHP